MTVLALVAIVLAVLHLVSTRTTVTLERGALARAYGLVDAAVAADAGTIMQAWQDSSALLFFAPNSAIALQDELFEEVRLLARMAELDISRPPLNTLDLAVADTMRISIMIGGNGRFEKILTFLRFVELGPRLIHLSDLSLSKSMPDAAIQDESNVRLDVRLTAFVAPRRMPATPFEPDRTNAGSD